MKLPVEVPLRVSNLARVDIPDLIHVAGNLNALDGGAQWPSLQNILVKYGIFDGTGKPVFQPIPLLFGQTFQGLFQQCFYNFPGDAENIKYLEFDAPSTGTVQLTLQVKDPFPGETRTGEWVVGVFRQRSALEGYSFPLERTGDILTKKYSFSIQQPGKHIIRIYRTSDISLPACSFFVSITPGAN